MNAATQIITIAIVFLFTVFIISFNSEIKRGIRIQFRKSNLKSKTKPEGKKKTISDIDLTKIYWE